MEERNSFHNEDLNDLLAEFEIIEHKKKKIPVQIRKQNSFDRYNNVNNGSHERIIQDSENSFIDIDTDGDWVVIPKENKFYEETCGELNCCSSQSKKFQLKQVLLEESRLIIYHGQEKKKSGSGSFQFTSIDLKSSQISSGYFDLKKERTFKITHTTPGRVNIYYFQTSTVKEYNDWFWKIKWNIDHCTRKTKYFFNNAFSQLNELNTDYTSISQSKMINNIIECEALPDKVIETLETNNKYPILRKDEFTAVEKNFLMNLSKIAKGELIDLLTAHLSSLFYYTDHIIALKIKNFLQTWKDAQYFLIYSETPQSSVNKFVEDYKKFRVEICNKVLEHYPEITKFAGIKNQLLYVIDELLFHRLFELIFPAYKHCYEETDLAFFRKIESLADISIRNIGINQKLWLQDQLLVNYRDYQMANSKKQKEEEPYLKAIKLFRTISTRNSANEKLNVLSKMSVSISDCINSYYNLYHPNNESNILVAGDDILPLFVYIVIKAAVPNIFSECKFMEDLIGIDKSMGEQGYFLVTLRTALTLISYAKNKGPNDDWLVVENDNNNLNYNNEFDDRKINNHNNESNNNSDSSSENILLSYPQLYGEVRSENNANRVPSPNSFLQWATSKLSSN